MLCFCKHNLWTELNQIALIAGSVAIMPQKKLQTMKGEDWTQ